MINNIKSEGRLIFLDVLRIFAFGSVLIGHKFYDVLDNLSNNYDYHITIRLFFEMVKALCWGGAAGVVVFFIISGYIITLVLQAENTKTFIIKRIFRIYPLYIAAVILETISNNYLSGAPYPPISVWIPRLLLIGDAFNTPYALSGVEWTLRIEVLFYFLMSIVKYFGMIQKASFLPLLYLLVVAILQISPAFPHHQGFGYGYGTLYLPFLFFGSCIFLMESKQTSKELGIFCMAYIYVSYLYFDSIISPIGKESHFAGLACLIFLAIWALKLNIKKYLLVTFFSEMTYSVYLFHDWLWSPLRASIQKYSYFEGHQRLQVLLLLLICCYFLHITIEKYGIRVGRKMMRIGNP